MGLAPLIQQVVYSYSETETRGVQVNKHTSIVLVYPPAHSTSSTVPGTSTVSLPELVRLGGCSTAAMPLLVPERLQATALHYHPQYAIEVFASLLYSPVPHFLRTKIIHY